VVIEELQRLPWYPKTTEVAALRAEGKEARARTAIRLGQSSFLLHRSKDRIAASRSLLAASARLVTEP
jgi:hypothetical protein